MGRHQGWQGNGLSRRLRGQADYIAYPPPIPSLELVDGHLRDTAMPLALALARGKIDASPLVMTAWNEAWPQVLLREEKSITERRQGTTRAPDAWNYSRAVCCCRSR